jgi:uncharacterized protein YqhQ
VAKQFSYGGQAVMEGVMMRGKKHYSIAVRKETGEITTITKTLSTTLSGRVRKIPLLRGILALIETLIIGVKSLMYSADMFMGEEAKDMKGKSWIMGFSMTLGIILALGLFIGIPLALTEYVVKPHVPSNVLVNVANGLIRLVIIIGYMYVIGLLPDVRRVFCYHGAEHKTINALEDGAPLEVAEVQKYGTAHPRCGTSFLLIVMVLAIVAYMFIPRTGILQRFSYQLVILPAVAAVSYEIIRITARYHTNPIVKLILMPGMFVQSITTKQPDDQQVEVGITALKTAMAADGDLVIEEVDTMTSDTIESTQISDKRDE